MLLIFIFILMNQLLHFYQFIGCFSLSYSFLECLAAQCIDLFNLIYACSFDLEVKFDIGLEPWETSNLDRLAVEYVD